MNSVKNILIFIIVFLSLLSGCTTDRLAFAKLISRKYLSDIEEFKQQLEKNKTDYILFQITGYGKYRTDVVYFIYQDDSTCKYLKISGWYRYRPQTIGISQWKDYCSVLNEMTNYDCDGEEDFASPPHTHPLYYHLTFSKNGVVVKSVFYDYQWLTTCDGRGVSTDDQVRRAESLFLHRFFNDISYIEMRDFDMPMPVEP